MKADKNAQKLCKLDLWTYDLDRHLKVVTKKSKDCSGKISPAIMVTYKQGNRSINKRKVSDNAENNTVVTTIDNSNIAVNE